LPDPRDFAAGAKDQLAAFEEAIRRTLGEGGVVLKAILAQGRREHRTMHALYMTTRYANAQGNVRALGLITPRWIRRKLALAAPMARGRFSEGIQRTINDRRSFVPLENGFDIDITIPNRTTRVPVRVPATKKKGSRFRRVQVNSYLFHYAEQKAPGLGSLSKAAIKRIQDARQKAEEKQLRRLRNIAISAAKGGTQRVVEVRAILKRFAA
jgi:hypothetical protein